MKLIYSVTYSVNGSAKTKIVRDIRKKWGIKKAANQRLAAIVGKTGFEPATPWSQTRCATGLRYFPMASGTPETSRKNKDLGSNCLERKTEARSYGQMRRVG